MPTDPNGVYTLPPSYFVQNGDPIQPVQHNPPFEDLQQAQTDRVMRDGRAAMTGNLNMDANRIVGLADGVGPNDAATVQQGVPTGAVISYLGATAPTGYLALSGGTFSRTTYARLYAWALASGLMAASEGAKTHAQFGPGDGATTFSLPNHNAGYFIRGWNNQAVGFDQGRNRAVVQDDQNLQHNHGGATASAGAHTHTGGADSAGAHTHPASTGSAGTHDHSGTAVSAGAHNHNVAGSTHSGTFDYGLNFTVGGLDSTTSPRDRQANTSTAGAHTHSLSINNAGAHTHSVSVTSAGAHTHSLSINSNGAHTHTIANDGGNEARPNNIALLFCIKT